VIRIVEIIRRFWPLFSRRSFFFRHEMSERIGDGIDQKSVELAIEDDASLGSPAFPAVSIRGCTVTVPVPVLLE